MIITTRTATKLRPILRHIEPVGQIFRPMTVLSKESGEEFKNQNYNARMKKTGRPVSPHVTIYAWPTTALSSITNRVTGVALSFGALGLAGAELAGGSGSALAVMEFFGSYGPLVAAGAKFSVAFPCVYHYLGGIRHLAWDKTPDMLNNADVEKSSYILFGSALAISGVFMIL